jgi:UDP-N-acetylglucosamine diphosphorylase / glucose-1-phosphate thymidylyltransferase / UDP-N-acetylgalactosamine diphosphorylase / glucosamine-1-phosphate N-acetyltransferase / galactosamine-1-phosphate N-acetyltransferase
MSVLLFEDPKTVDLFPIATARPTYAITCGGYRLIDLVRKLNMPIAGIVRDYLYPIQVADFSDIKTPDEGLNASGSLVVLRARTVPRLDLLQQLPEWLKRGRCCIRDAHGVVMAVLPASDPLRSKLDQADDFVATLDADTSLPSIAGDPSSASGADANDRSLDLPQFELPHDVVAWHMKLMREGTEHRIAGGAYREVRDGLFVGQNVKLGEYLVCNTQRGPIVLDDHVEVGPFCYLAGPVYAGTKTRVIEHASLKDAVALGHTVKIGGEVEASVVEPYSNKQHHGFLGHSYLGSWINLGAGTCNSDLKNTYGLINMDYGSQKVGTGMQFLGCMMGDYSKTAINTGIFTGKVVGVCSMLYGFVTTNVPSFVNYARLFGQVASIPPDVMVATQQRMFARRNVQQRDCDRQLIHDMYRLTAAERSNVAQLLGS